jgi:NTE family protein
MQALAVTASSYSTGDHVTFFEGRQAPHALGAHAAFRCARQASPMRTYWPPVPSPLYFRPRNCTSMGGNEYFGRRLHAAKRTLLAPAIHLGAERILVVGAGRMHEPKNEALVPAHHQQLPVSIAQIAGHALSNIFFDALAVDVERVRRINQTIKLVPEEAHAKPAHCKPAGTAGDLPPASGWTCRGLAPRRRRCPTLCAPCSGASGVSSQTG